MQAEQELLKVESRGSKLKSMFVKPDPFPREKCDKQDCKDNQCREKCCQAHVNYEIICKDCDSCEIDIRYV